MARMNRCNAWSTAITPHSTVANPGLPAIPREPDWGCPDLTDRADGSVRLPA
jgi:hypothetical protein